MGKILLLVSTANESSIGSRRQGQCELCRNFMNGWVPGGGETNRAGTMSGESE